VERSFKHVDGAVGLPFPGMQCKLIDDDGNEVGPDIPGELLIKGILV
jgi:acyl-coenzyme A synthetase/AMP-(fatty) acid ligase